MSVLGDKLRSGGIYMVAEIGIAHHANLCYAYELVKAASQAGADAVKFQVRDVETSTPKERWREKKALPWDKSCTMDYIDYRRIMEFSDDEHLGLRRYAAELDMECFWSVFDLPSLRRVAKWEPVAIKIPSAQNHNSELVRDLWRVNTHVDTWRLVSCGMGGNPIMPGGVPMACSSIYPCPPHLSRAMWPRLEGNPSHPFWNPYWGYSGHEVGWLPTLVAAARGARIIERHIRRYDDIDFSDRHCSLTTHGFTEMVAELRQIEQMRQVDPDEVFEEELPAIKRLRGES